MKYILGLLMFVFALSSNAQSTQTKKIIREINNIKGNTINVETDFFDATIITWNKNKILVEAVVEINQANYLKKMDVQLTKTDYGAKIKSDIKFNDNVKSKVVNVKSDMVIYVPKNMHLSVNSEFGDIHVTGPLKGYNLDCEFGDVYLGIDNPSVLSLSEVRIEHGDCTLAVNANEKIKFKIDTDFGDLSTNLDLVRTGKDEYTLNNGDMKLTIESDFGDVNIIGK